jgi:7 transmembrane sweet-taste receptor of 3 GCPR
VYSRENETPAEEGDALDSAVWRPVNNVDFLFYDGTSNEPMPLRDVSDANYLSKRVQTVGIVLSSFALCFAVLCCVWVFMNRKHKLVRASQPAFLYLLCSGAALVAPSILFISFDEGKGVSEEQLSKMCSAFPWFFVIGYLTMYCALFCKLWRLSKLLNFRRISVNVKQVLWPYITVIACSLVVLTTWQVIDPLVWVRVVISEPGAPYVTFGECTSIQYSKTPFVIALGCLIFLAVATTAVFSWKLRDVPSEFAETRWIFACICLHMQMWFIGAPLVYITFGVSKDASYLMVLGMTVTFSVSQVGLVIGPKILEICNEKHRRASNTRISFNAGQTYVSGLMPSTDDSQRRLSNLFLANENAALLARIEFLENQLRETQKSPLQDGLAIISLDSTTENRSTAEGTTNTIDEPERRNRGDVEMPLP